MGWGTSSSVGGGIIWIGIGLLHWLLLRVLGVLRMLRVPLLLLLLLLLKLLLSMHCQSLLVLNLLQG